MLVAGGSGHNRLRHGWGTVCGLGVAAAAESACGGFVRTKSSARVSAAETPSAPGYRPDPRHDALGGDFFDVFKHGLKPKELSLCLGSVSGVGVAACVAATTARHSASRWRVPSSSTPTARRAASWRSGSGRASRRRSAKGTAIAQAMAT